MELGVTLRNMGAESEVSIISRCAKLAEGAGLESLWITDHIAIPPDDAEGSDGRYVDPLITLAWIAGATDRIHLGTGVLILPYRGALITARQVASLQELSEGRVLLGVGIGWMDAEFRVLGLDRRRRGSISDQTLQILNSCFDSDEVELNGQRFLFKPRPKKPPVLVGGRAPHALERAAQYGDGWIPMGLEPESVPELRAQYHGYCERAGRAAGSITIMSGLPLADVSRSRARLDAYRDVGIERFVCGIRYQTVDDYEQQMSALHSLIT
mgnify:CR=1 FL=1